MIKISEVNFNEASCVSHYSPRKFLTRVSAECNNGKKTEGKGYIYIETISDLRFMIDFEEREGCVYESLRGGGNN